MARQRPRSTHDAAWSSDALRPPWLGFGWLTCLDSILGVDGGVSVLDERSASACHGLPHVFFLLGLRHFSCFPSIRSSRTSVRISFVVFVVAVVIINTQNRQRIISMAQALARAVAPALPPVPTAFVPPIRGLNRRFSNGTITSAQGPDCKVCASW